MAMPHAFKQTRLHLVRSEEFPTGAARHRCELIAPVDATAHIGATLWKRLRNYCRVRRFWRNELDHIGHSIHRLGGSERTRWVFDYESGYRFGSHMFSPGEYGAPHYEDGASFPSKIAK